MMLFIGLIINYNLYIQLSRFFCMSKPVESRPSDSTSKIDLTSNTCKESHLEESINQSGKHLDDHPKCPRCRELEERIQFLQKEMEKLSILLNKKSDLSIQLSQEKVVLPASTHPVASKRLKTPRNSQKVSFFLENMAIDWEAEKSMLRLLEEKAEKLCEKEKKERKIIKQLISDRDSLRSSKVSFPTSSKKQVEIESQKEMQGTVETKEIEKMLVMQPVQIQIEEANVEVEPLPEKVQNQENKQIQAEEIKEDIEYKAVMATSQERGETVQEKEVEKPERRSIQEEVRSEDSKQIKREPKTSSRLKKAATTIMYSSSKGDEFSSQLDDLMEGLNQSDVSDPSGSPTSERKSVLEGMKNEELKEYYTKNLKRQKLMAKLKKKK